jgi:hypothetical protein
MAWKWKNGKAYLEAHSPTSAPLLLTAGYEASSPIPVPQISPLEAYRTLGVYISPSGSMKKALSILLTSSIEYASSVMGSTFTRE